VQQAKTRVKLPASMATNAEDVKPDPDDVLDYIPGFCFIDLLDSLPQSARPGKNATRYTLISIPTAFRI
jgi:hypothetical protein